MTLRLTLATLYSQLHSSSSGLHPVSSTHAGECVGLRLGNSALQAAPALKGRWPLWGTDFREPATFKRWAPEGGSAGASGGGPTSSGMVVDKQGSGQQEGLMQRVMQQAVYVEQQVVAKSKQLVDKILYEEVPVVS